MESKNRPLVVARMVRLWAQDQGVQVAERGRLPQHVIDQYREAKQVSAKP